jgi:hypothetical protein
MSRTRKIKERSQRFVEVLKWGATNTFSSRSKKKGGDLDSRITFLIAHFNSPEFLAACLDAIRKYHPGSSILVADATSDWDSYLAAKKECKRFNAQMRPLAIQHRHSGILNFLFQQAKTDFAVFLDQDCILLHRLDSILETVGKEILLAGPRDKMLLDYPLRSGTKPDFKPTFLRSYQNYVHASLMVLQPEKIRAAYGSSPFRWQKSFGDHVHEKYHGLSHQLHASQPKSLLLLDSIHSSYGLGMIYLHNNVPLAYHNWYSGRVFKQQGKLDGLPIDSLKGAMDRFLHDYWAKKLDFGLPSTH